MFRNYLKVALRQIRKNKLYSFINILGLSAGITACMLIGLYVWNELRYDQFHANGTRIARVTMEYSSGGEAAKTSYTGTKVGPQFQRTFPQVEAFARCIKRAATLANGNKLFDEKSILFADADFFKIFSFHLLRGNSSTVLISPNTIVLSQSSAKKYFGEEDPMGKTLRYNDNKDYEVTGIVEDAPLYSQIQYSAVASFTSLNASKTEEWFSANYFTYLLLHDPQQMQGLEKGIADYMKQLRGSEFPANEPGYLTYHLEPLRSVHLHSSLEGLEPAGNMTYIYVLSVLAVLILLIACVNYTNLATAQSSTRTTEVGIRKVLGAGSPGLFRQLIGESVVLAAVSIILSIVAGISLLPLFNHITLKSFTPSMLLDYRPLIGLLILGVFVSFLAGSYPAWVLSKIGLIKILKTGARVTASGGGFRKSLIVLQFVISGFLIVATIIIMQQIAFIRQKDIGYDKEQVLVIPLDQRSMPIYDPLKKAILACPQVKHVTGAYESPAFVGWGDGISANNGKEQKSLNVTAMPVDLDFIQTFGMHIVAGTDFSPADFQLQDTANNYVNYRNTFILNEKAASDLGWKPEQAIGQTISKGSPGIIKAVVKDFNFASLHNSIGPMVLFLDTSQTREMYVKISGANIASTLGTIEKTWKERIPGKAFNYHFLDEDFNALYSTEERTVKLFTVFAILAIALACLGLFALAAFSTVQRKKEIGIRKVLGANIGQITLLVGKEFIQLVLISFVISVPLAWVAANSWLQNFAFRIQIAWWVFLIAGILALLVAFFTISYHAIRAARANPVKSLRTE